MDELQKQILEAVTAGFHDLRAKMQAGFAEFHEFREETRTGFRDIRNELKEFRESQDVTNKLLLGELRGTKNELRDFKGEVKSWQRYTDARLDSLEGTLERMRYSSHTD
jgi:uncharacterized coiled-coil DUF342 family protein